MQRLILLSSSTGLSHVLIGDYGSSKHALYLAGSLILEICGLVYGISNLKQFLLHLARLLEELYADEGYTHLAIDRVFVHALNTVKKIPRTGSPRPPPTDRLRLYGLYKQAMEGDVDGVMERPGGRAVIDAGDDDLKRERDKWDAWNAQKGIGKTEAKRRYIEALIDTMHHYASNTTDARELVAELEFVWDQIKNNSSSSTSSSPLRPGGGSRTLQQPGAVNEGPMRVLSPMSQDDAAEQETGRRMGFNIPDDEDGEDEARPTSWRQKVEMAMARMSTEMAALREQIATGREYQGRRARSFGAWIGWLVWLALRHVLVDALILGIVLFYMRKRKDRRLEDLIRQILRLGREYARRILPPR